jgi:hypothetical protein
MLITGDFSKRTMLHEVSFPMQARIAQFVLLQAMGCVIRVQFLARAGDFSPLRSVQNDSETLSASCPSLPSSADIKNGATGGHGFDSQ